VPDNILYLPQVGLLLEEAELVGAEPSFSNTGLGQRMAQVRLQNEATSMLPVAKAVQEPLAFPCDTMGCRQLRLPSKSMLPVPVVIVVLLAVVVVMVAASGC